MKAVIINLVNELTRKRWEFSLWADFSGASIQLDFYVLETKKSTRDWVWHCQDKWGTFGKRNNTINEPPMDANVESEVRQLFINQIKDLPIKIR
jgi:hypothetical protein